MNRLCTVYSAPLVAESTPKYEDVPLMGPLKGMVIVFLDFLNDWSAVFPGQGFLTVFLVAESIPKYEDFPIM
jgi:hypothetical protein